MTTTESSVLLKNSLTNATSSEGPEVRLTDALLPAPIAITLAAALSDDGPLVLNRAQSLPVEQRPPGIRGDADLLGWARLPVQISFPNDQALRLGVTGPTGPLTQAGLDWIDWTDVGLSLEVATGGEVQASEVKGKIWRGSISMTGALITDSEGAPCWVASSSKEVATLPKLGDWFPLAGRHSLLDAVKSQLGTALSGQTNAVRVLLQPSEWGARSTTNIETAASWLPFDGAPPIENVALTIGGGGQLITVCVSGAFRLNGSADLGASIEFRESPEGVDFTFKLNAEESGKPIALTDLISAAAGPGLIESFPQPVRDKVAACALQAASLDVYRSGKFIRAVADGVLFGFEGNISLQVTRDTKPNALVLSLECQPQPSSIRKLLGSLGLEQSVIDQVPDWQISLAAIRFDSETGQLRIEGDLFISGAQAALWFELNWSPTVSLELGFWCPAAPLRLDALLPQDALDLLPSDSHLREVALRSGKTRIGRTEFSLEMEATLWEAGSLSLGLSVARPATGTTGKPTLKLQAVLRADPVPLSKLLTLFGASQPDVALDGLAFVPVQLEVDTAQSKFMVSAALAVDASKGRAELSPQNAAGGGTTVSISLTAESGSKLDLSALLEKILGDKLPAELPRFTTSGMSLTVTPKSGTFRFSGNGDAEWQRPFGARGRPQLTGTLAVERAAPALTTQPPNRAPVTAALNFQCKGMIAIADGLRFNGGNLAFTKALSGWSLNGGFQGIFFNESAEFKAGMEIAGDARTFEFATKLSGDALAIPDIVALTAANVVLKARSATTPAVVAPSAPATTPTTAPATSTSARTWDLSLVAAATLKLGGQPGFSGNLVLAHGATADSIALELTPGSRVSAKLPFPNHEVTVNVEAGRFSFASQAPSAGSQTRTWVLEAAGALRIEGLPQRLAEILPRSISGSIRADPAGVIISANRVVQDQSIQLPALEVGKTKAELGQVGIDIPSLRVGIGREVTLTADLGLGLPCELNHIFGSKSDGTPAVEFFNTYQPGKADSFFRLAVEIGTAGLSLRPLTSPIRAIKSVVENGEAWWNCDFGNFGAAKVRVPVLTYDAATTAFRASGGFVITRPLKVPLAPFKKILEAGGLGAASQAFPDGVPLKDITLVNSEGHLRTDELTQMLQEVSEGQIPNEVTDAIETIGDRLDQLPDRFKKYLSIQVPDGFNFDLSAAPEGNVRLDARVKDPNQPIRLLLPSLALAPVPVPALNGIELRSVSFGELLGGSLFQIHVDADFDQFDLINLAASLLLPDSDSSLLPRPHDLQRHLCLDRLFMIVVYQTGIPIPVPIFYDNVGLEALEFAGHGFGLRWQFPQPKPGAGDLMGFFRDIKPFFTDSDYLLPTATDDDVFARHNLGLKFSVNPGYIQLPKYLGGKLLGQKGELFSVSLTKGLAEMLNALKKPSLARLLGVVPLSYRVGEEEITFGPMSVQVAWAMTTSEEFRGLDSASGQPGKFLQRLNELPAGQREEMLTLANLGTASDEGAFVLLLGDWSLASQVSFSVRLALAQAANGRAGFGFGLNGRLGDVLEFEAGGCAIFGHAESPNLSAIRECQALVDRLDPEVARLKQEIADRNDRLGSDQKNLTKLNADLRQFQMRLPGLQRFRGWRMNADLGDADAPPEKIGSVPAGGRRVNPRLADVDDPRFKGPGGPGGYGNYWGQAGGLKTAPGGQTTPRDVPAGGDPPVRVGPPAPGAQAFQKMITESETKIADLKNQIPQLESAIAESRATIASASANLSEAEPQLTRARSELANLIPQQATWKDTGIQINGHCRLTLLGDEVLTGKLALTDREFAVEGALDLFPRSPLLRITGQLAGRISDQEFALAGAASMVLGGTFTLASATAEITQIGARVRGTWLNQTVTFSIQKCNGGAQLSAAMSKISVGDILSITDASGASGPTAILTTADSPRLTLSGGASLLGLSTTTDVVFTEGNVRFAGTGNLFGVFQAALAVSGSDLMNGGALQVTATFESDLFRYLIEQGTDALQKAIEGASKGVDSAKAEVDAKQKDVDSLDQQIKDMRATIEGERRAATSNLSDAQATVDKWQREVNSLNGQIESTKRDYYNLPKSDWVWNKSQITEAIPFAATISSLEAAKYSATAFLEASNQVLEGIKKGAQLTPVEMDPRMFGLMGAQETATFALNRAKEILEAAQKAIGAVGDVANYIDNHGIANLLNVTAARFSASLTEAATGVVSLSADVIYMGRPGTVDFAFNFMNPIEGAKSLANRLLHP